MIKRDNQKNKPYGIFTMLALLAVYCILAAIVWYFVIPYAQEILTLYLQNKATVWHLLQLILLLGLLIIGTFAVLYLISQKYQAMRTAAFQDPKTPDGDNSKSYSSERRYLEQKIAELTTRLTDTEEKFAALNHLILEASSKNIQTNEPKLAESFLAGLGIDPNAIEIDSNLIFVLAPADPEYAKDYKTVKETCRACHLNAIRGSNEEIQYGNKDMLKFIIEHILAARIVVANISNRNPNVFYELGIAHMAGKPTILLCRSGETVPFDLQHRFVVFYSSQDELSHRLKEALVSLSLHKNII